jgi:hypothetical protein
MKALTSPRPGDIQPEAAGWSKGTASPQLFGQVRQHGLTGLLGFGERLKGRSTYPDGGPVEVDGAPRSYKAWPPVESRTTATLVTDYK